PDESLLAGHARPGPLAGLRPGIVLLGIVLLGVGLLAVGLRSPSVVLLGVGLPGLGVGLLAVGLRSLGVVLPGVVLPGLGFELGGLGRVEVVLVGGLRVRCGLFRLDGLGGVGPGHRSSRAHRVRRRATARRALKAVATTMTTPSAGGISGSQRADGPSVSSLTERRSAFGDVSAGMAPAGREPAGAPGVGLTLAAACATSGSLMLGSQ